METVSMLMAMALSIDKTIAPSYGIPLKQTLMTIA